jgi:hypothetical protein
VGEDDAMRARGVEWEAIGLVEPLFGRAWGLGHTRKNYSSTMVRNYSKRVIFHG